MGLQDHDIARTISRKANGPVTTPNRFVVPTGTDRQVAVASALNAATYGVIEQTTRLDQDLVRIVVAGIAWVETGGAIADGAAIISDAVGRAIAVPAGLQAPAQVAGYARGSASSSGSIVGVELGGFAQTVPGGFKLMTFAGHNLAGPCTATGLKVGDVIVSVAGLTTVGNAAALFETTVSVADQIQQSSATDLHASNYQALVYTG